MIEDKYLKDLIVRYDLDENSIIYLDSIKWQFEKMKIPNLEKILDLSCKIASKFEQSSKALKLIDRSIDITDKFSYKLLDSLEYLSKKDFKDLDRLEISLSNLFGIKLIPKSAIPSKNYQEISDKRYHGDYYFG